MYCDRCNIDFPEGLRYCKWCGQQLSPRRRITSELVVCPSCGEAVQQGWAFCKSCGARLTGEIRPATAGPQTTSGALDTAVISHCSACGEVLDSGTMYCKACGAPNYPSAVAPSGSALLCAVCNSYSPLGSSECRICGAPFAQTSSKAMPEQDTLRDLPEHLGQTHPGYDDSGAQTLVFDEKATSGSLATRVDTEIPRAADTNVLPGVAGARLEQQQATSAIEKGRITSPVESEPEPRIEPDASVGGEAAVSTAGLGSEVETPRVVEVAQAPPPATRETPLPIAASETETRVFATGQAAGEIAFGSSGSLESGAVAQPVAEQAVRQTAVTVQAPAKKRSGTLVISALVVAVVLGVAGYGAWWFIKGGGRRPEQPRVSAPVTPPEPVATPTPPPPLPPVPPEGMVLVPAGTYVIGRNDGDPIEVPQHTVKLDAFFIDRTEVTNAQYLKFIDTTSRRPPAEWKGGAPKSGQGNLPVTGVSWQDAADYAAWVGKRLPTEAEWEAAARGSEGRRYPWGQEWRPGVTNIGTKAIGEVGQLKEGASPFGVLDLIGNVWEWTADEFALYPGNSGPKPANLKPELIYRVIRGGAYDGDERHDAAYRGYVDASRGYDRTGFRCAKTAPQSGQ